VLLVRKVQAAIFKAMVTRFLVGSRPDSAQTAGSRYAARAEKPRWASIFSAFGLSMPDDGRFPYRATHSLDWPADGTIFPVPHTSSPLVHCS